MDSIIQFVVPYMDTSDLVNLSFINSRMYVNLHSYVNTLYTKFIKSNLFKNKVISLLNYKANIINDLKFNNSYVNELSNKYMYEYVILCYENWVWLSIDEYKNKLNIPNSSIFTHFMDERKINMKSILPSVKFVYTHIHRPTKQFTYYTHLCT
jgi:hypothetical protein